MDGRTGLVVVCLVAGGAWALLVLALLGGRVRATAQSAPAPRRSSPEDGEWRSPRRMRSSWSGSATRTGDDGRDALLLPRRSRSDEPGAPYGERDGARPASRDRHDWAIDGLVEALAEASENPSAWPASSTGWRRGRGPRLPPLLGHPSSVVRFYAVRLLARYPALADAARPAHDTRTRRRTSAAAALETLGRPARPAGAPMRAPAPGRPASAVVRAQACRTAAASRGRHCGAVRRPAPRATVVVGARGRARGARCGRSRRHGAAVERGSTRAHDRRCGAGRARAAGHRARRRARRRRRVGRLERILDAGGGRLRGTPRPSAHGGASSSATGGALEAEAPRDASRPCSESACPDVRRLPGVVYWLVHSGLMVVGLRGEPASPARARGRRRRHSVRLAVRARRQHRRARRTTRATALSGRGSLAPRARLPGVRGDRRQRRLDATTRSRGSSHELELVPVEASSRGGARRRRRSLGYYRSPPIRGCSSSTR